jgi:hypothetical protein
LGSLTINAAGIGDSMAPVSEATWRLLRILTAAAAVLGINQERR